MKRVSLLFAGLLMMGLFAFSQPTQMTLVDFENGLPAGWTASNAAVETVTSVVSRGNASLRIKNTTTAATTFTSPTFTRNAGCNVRLEFSHIPMLQNGEGNGKVEVSFNNGTTWHTLIVSGGATAPTGYDATYGFGASAGHTWSGSFSKIIYWPTNTNILESNLDSTYWRNEIFYLNNAFANYSAGSNSFKIRFTVGTTSSATNIFSGWFLDDIRLYQAVVASNVVRVPQLKSLNYPNTYIYPNCTDIPIEGQIQFLQSSPPAVADSIYIEYILGSSTTIHRSRMNIISSSDGLYRGIIPFNGYDSIVKWRLVINDNLYNKLTFPYVLGQWNEFKNIRGFEGSPVLRTSGLSSQELLFKTNTVRNLFQFRYKASELQAVGMSAGRLAGLFYNVTQAAPGFLMQGLNVFIQNIPTSYELLTTSQYSGAYEHVLGPVTQPSPPIGWQYLAFDADFIWDGTSDILLKVCWDNGYPATIGGTTKIESFGTGSSDATGQFYQTGLFDIACESGFNPANPQINFKPNFRFNFERNCVLRVDVGISDSLIVPNDYIVTANSPTPFTVGIANYGTDTMHTVNVKYQIDNGPVVTAGTWTGTLLPSEVVNYNFPTNISFLPGYRYMKVWTELPSNMIDWEPSNDTAFFEIVSCNGPMNGEYAVGNISGFSADRKFNNFKEVFKMLKGCGVSAPVTFKILNLPAGQFYQDTLKFPINITGASATNYIKFTSVSNTAFVNIKPNNASNHVINLSDAKFYRFERIKFYSADNYSPSDENSNIIKMSNTTSDIEFKNCHFIKNPLSTSNLYYFVNISSANKITIDSSTFDGDAFVTQVYVQGYSPTSLSTDINIKNSLFTNNLRNAISVGYAKNVNIIGNRFENNRTLPAQSVYNVLIESSKEFNISKNLFILTNVSAINANNILSSTTPSIIANNKISVDNANSTGLQTSTYGINISSGNDILVAYNNIYARDRGNFGFNANGLNIGSTGQSISNIKIKNNIIVSDGNGYAVYARPSTGSVFEFSNNIYWKLHTLATTPSPIIWRFNATNCTTITDWQTVLGNGDANSFLENPIFTDWNNLYTSNTFLCYKATHLTEVVDDFNSTSRPTIENPCIGALQFNPPPSNIFVQQVWIDRGDQLLAPDGNTIYSDCGIGSEDIFIKFKNISNNTIAANSLKFWYKIDNLAIPALQKDTIHHIILPDSVYTYKFRTPYNFAVTNADREFKITAFSVLTADTVRTNDTAICYVLSRNQLPAMSNQTRIINYGDTAILDVISNDSIYWFLRSDDATPILKSHSYHTDMLFSDTTFYFSRKEEVAKLKIAEIQFSRLASASGITPNLPSWVTVNNVFEIANYGNGAINLEGYKLAYVTGNSVALNPIMTKTFVLPNFLLPANSSVSLQIRTGTSTDSLQYFNLGSGASFAAIAKAGFLLHDNLDNVIDAVTINGAQFDTATHVPTSVWTGEGIMVPTGTAGIIRTIRDAADSNGWVASSSTNLMSIGTFDSTQIWKRDNGCYGYKSSFIVSVSGVPSVDPGVASVKLAGINSLAKCTLTEEDVVVRLINTGVQTCLSTPLVMEVYENDILINTYLDTCNIPIQPNDTVTFTFSQSVNLSANTGDKLFRIKCFTNLATDVVHLNDTSQMQITSLQTPYSPTGNDVSIPYASSTTLTASTTSNDVLIWYNSPTSLHELDRTTYTTPVLYETDTFYVGAMLLEYDTIELGSATTFSNSYPSPLNSHQKNVKEQYLIKASEISNLGFSEGNINSIMFKVHQVTAASILNNYTIKIGTTNQEALTTWIYGLEEVYFDSAWTITNASSDLGWKTFTFDEPFYYDGQSNIIIEICFTRPGGSTGPVIRTYYTTTDFNSVLSYRSANVNACLWTGAPMSGGATMRPNISFDIDKFGCSSVRTPVVVTVGAPPACDASITSIVSPATTTVMSGVSVPIEVELKNYGSEALTATGIAWSVNGVMEPLFNWTGNLAAGAATTVTLGNKIFTSGNNNITAWPVLTCDTINNNDTSSFDFSSCIGNNTSTTHLSIGGAGATYPTFSAAITALVNSGICGNVVFDVNPLGVDYNEQVYIPSIIGTETGNTITFRGNASDSNTVVLTYDAGTNTDNFTVKFDGSSNIIFENFTIKNFSSSYPNVVEFTNSSSNIKFESMVIQSTPLANATTETAKLINIDGANNNLIFSKVHFFGGATQINADLPLDTVSNNIAIENSFFNSFAFNGISFNGANNIKIEKNKFREYANTNISRGISLRYLYGSIEILSNDIYLSEGTNAVRIGMEIKRSYSPLFSPAIIANNSISLSGPYINNQLAYIGLDIDSVEYANIYYNTIKVRATNNSLNSRTINIGRLCVDIKVMNNIFDNSGKGIPYYVFAPATQVTLSNNNNYITNGNIIAFWAGNKLSIDALQTANSQDNMSVSVANPFVNDSVLDLLFPSEVVRQAEPLEDISIDILGRFRPLSPRPTIGAYEYQFTGTDGGPIALLSVLPNIKYVENDPINVQVKVKNFGLFTVDTIQVTAVLKYNADTTHIIQTVTQEFVTNLSSLQTDDLTINSPIYPPLHFRNLTDSLHLSVFTTIQNDTNRYNDTIKTNFLVVPAYNAQNLKTEPITERCQLHSVPIKMVIKSIGEKSLVLADSIWVGYQVEGRPDLETRELIPLYDYDDGTGTPYDSIQKNGQMTYTFVKKANLYPLGLNDTTWSLRTYISFKKDNIKTNDTSNYITVNSRVSPPAPITYDTAIHYGTWAEPWARQINSYPIKWFADSNDASPFYSPNAYVASMKYRTTQLFTDSTFYLRVNLPASFPCQSNFTPLRVTLLDRSPIDGACIGLQGQGVVEPPKEGWVYMTEADTIKVKVSNYGTMPMQNFYITYSIQQTSPADSPIINVTELCSATIQSNNSYTYKFDSLADFSDPSKTYRIRAWVDVANDATALNDTSTYWLVKPKNGNTIYPSSFATNASSIDITRVQLGNMDNSSNNSGYSYTNFTNTLNPVVLFKGVYDSLYVYCDKPSSIEDTNAIGGWVRAFIDWNRDGVFDFPQEQVLSDTIWTGSMAKSKITIPAGALTGHSRMRIILWQNKDMEPFYADASPNGGEVEDYKVFVRDTWDVNAELMKFTKPEEFLITQTHDVKVVLRNTGKTTLNNATIHWKRNEQEFTYNWNGSLATAERTEVTLQNNMVIPTGMNKFTAWVDVAGDPYHENDTIKREAYIFKTFSPPYANNFDEGGLDDFYAANSNPLLPNNCWEIGTPDSMNATIKGPFSAPNCWKTKLSGKYPSNNESVLYSPIFNINVIKPDTLSFMMRRQLATGTYMHVEYKNYNGTWKRLGAMNDGYGTNWFNDEENGFSGNSAWQECIYSIYHIYESGDLGNDVQFRFVFRSANANNDGFAIDDFVLKRALRPQDAGVIDVVVLPLPNFGSYYYPTVTIRNYGSETLTNYSVCYSAQDMHIPICESIIDHNIEPRETYEYTFRNGKYVNFDLPDPFSICAFTRLSPSDLYSDNDSTCRQIVIGPLQKDAALLEIISPETNIVSNNMITVKIHVKNIGLDPIFSLPVGYKVTGQNEVLETITLNPPLYNNEEYIYTFNNQYRSSYGSSNVKVWVGLPGDYYADNDTLYVRTNGASETRDLEAKYITIDDYNTDHIGVQLTFVNNSSIGVRNVVVGYYYNGDINNAVEENYRLGNVVPSNAIGHHYFTATLPRANAPYQGICGYVRLVGDNNSTNDETCNLMMGVRDIKIDTIFIQNTSNPNSLVQIKARNVGTIGGPTTLNAGFVLDDYWPSPRIKSFNLTNQNEPNEVLYLTFGEHLIPRNDQGIYNITGWVDYQYDANRSNDTTKIYKVVQLIGLEPEADSLNAFTLNQNIPNPLKDNTMIEFYLPTAGNTRFFIVNNMGQLIRNENKFYPEGKHQIHLKDLNLPQGIYYYSMEFEGQRLMKKMIIAK